MRCGHIAQALFKWIAVQHELQLAKGAGRQSSLAEVKVQNPFDRRQDYSARVGR
jgi:hypothetical protein